MKATIRPSTLKGIIHAPASKSSMQRGLAAAFLTGETWDLFNAGFSNDDNASINIIKSLGAKVSIKNNKQVTISKSNDAVNEINCGESGLGMRMFVPIAALSERNITINGEGSLLNRPMDFFDEVLPQLGVKIKSNSGKLPLEIKGPLKPKDIHIDGSMSSQFLTGLLMAYAGSGAEDVTINVKNLASKPYIDLTLQVMEHFGLGNVENRSYEEFYFHPSNERKNLTHEYEVEGDWSGGAFLLVAGAIAGPITVRGLDLTSTQADKAIVDALMLANAGIAIEAKGIRIHPVEMKGFVFDASDCPDLFPPLVALAAHCKGRTTIYGVNRLIHKESNRALTLQEEFDQMGVLVKLERDEMIIQGNGNVKGADVHSHHDHRIAMALTIAALKANDETVIENAHAVNKSYPGFFNDLIKLGADISLNNKIKLHE